MSLNLQRYREEKLNKSNKRESILQDTISLLEQYEEEEDILYKLQEDYRLSDDEAVEYLQEAEEIFLEKFDEEEDEPKGNQIKSDEEINKENQQAKRFLSFKEGNLNFMGQKANVFWRALDEALDLASDMDEARNIFWDEVCDLDDRASNKWQNDFELALEAALHHKPPYEEVIHGLDGSEYDDDGKRLIRENSKRKLKESGFQSALNKAKKQIAHQIESGRGYGSRGPTPYRILSEFLNNSQYSRGLLKKLLEIISIWLKNFNLN